MTDATVTLLSCLLGFAVGVALHGGGTCAVGAARSLAWHGETGPTLGLLLAMAVAGMIVLPAAWAAGGAVRLATSAPVDLRLLAGGVLLGVGATVNGACLLGSLTRLGDGELRLLALPLGLGLGFRVAGGLDLSAEAAATRNALSAPSAAGLALVAGSALLAISFALLIRRRGDDRLLAASVALGAAGALLFLLRPGWSYADLVHQRFAAAMQLAGAPATGAALATIVGAASLAWMRRAFRWQPPTLAGLARSLAGGALMAGGSVLVPGGNDALLLAAVPAGVPSGIVAWAVMTATVIGFQAVARALHRRNPQAL